MVIDTGARRRFPATWQALTEFETIFNKACDNLGKAK